MTEYFYQEKKKALPYMTMPLFLFEDEQYSGLTAEAKILYAAMQRRIDLSRKNGWLDDFGRVYQYYTLSGVQGLIGCSKQKAVSTLRELEQVDLLERKRQGQGKPSVLFLKTPKVGKAEKVGQNSSYNLADLEYAIVQNAIF